MTKPNLFQKTTATIRKPFKKLGSWLGRTINRFPLISFFSLLVILFGLVFLAKQLGQPPAETETQAKEPKAVDTYRIGTTPKLKVQATIDKAGVVTIVSQGAGIVSQLYADEGKVMTRGQWVLSLVSNYQGGNAPALQRQLAQTSYEFAKDNLPLQQELISKRREIADKTDVNADEMNELTRDSFDRTRQIIDNSRQSLEFIEDQIEALDETAADYEESLQGFRQQKLGLLNGLAAAEQGLRTAEYSTDDDNPPIQLSNISKDMTLRQLDLEERSLQLNVEISRLNYQLAQVSEAMMFPAMPFAGRIEKVFVKVGQAVNPGTPLVSVAGVSQSITAEALVPQDIAKSLNPLEPSILYFNDLEIETKPTYVSTEPTEGRLFSVFYTISTQSEGDLTQKGGTGYDLTSYLTQGQSITVELPVGTAQSSSAMPFVPLDAVYQTENEAYVFILKDNAVTSQAVELGPVFGSFVQVKSGITGDTDVILDRTVVAGEPVKIQD